MPAPIYQVAEYLAAMQAMLPRGRAWPRDPDATMTKVLSGLVKSVHDSNVAAGAMLTNTFPASAGTLVEEWEGTLGLPGIFGELAATQAGRQQAVVATLIDSGGQSAPYFVGLSAALGIPITITVYTTFNVNRPVGTPIADDQWAHVWTVNAPISGAVSYVSTADVVQSTPGFGNPILEAVLGKHKPAHTVCITSYT